MPGVSYHAFDDKVYVHSIDTQRDYIFEGIALDILNFFAENKNSTLENLCEKLSAEYAIEDADEYKNILRQAREMGCISVLFTGGEVLIRPDFCDIVECETSLGFIVNIYTTGLGLTDEIFERLCAAKVNGISVSLYSGIASEHDKITGVKGSFEKTLKAALMFKSAGVNTFIKCVAMKQNFDSLESLYKLGKRLNLYVTIAPRVV